MDALAPAHLILIGIAALVLFFGWKQLPDMSRSLGRSLRLFKTELSTPATDQATTAAAPAVVAPVVVAVPVEETSDVA